MKIPFASKNAIFRLLPSNLVPEDSQRPIWGYLSICIMMREILPDGGVYGRVIQQKGNEG